jgi:hypothetical protein
MKAKVLAILFCGLVGGLAMAQDHSHHPPHNMALYGNKGAVYLSHLVYKAPHNYQVILKVNFPEKYGQLFSELESHPDDQFIMVLENLEIGRIQEKPALNGMILRIDQRGSKDLIFDKASLEPSDYSIIYFAELPLSLATNSGASNIVATRSHEGCQWMGALMGGWWCR